ncbi:hypothetical protein IW262DRAFT_1467040 [Armillaria fumosa]|nr:hypothetical protein IW262DRAFT_1467040 [Armillaria fumosa]
MTPRQTLTISTFQALVKNYTVTLLNPFAFQMTTSSISMMITLDNAKGLKGYLLCPSPIAYMSLPIPIPHRIRQTLCGNIREHVTHIWEAHASSPTLENASTAVVAKFHDPLYFLDEYESVTLFISPPGPSRMK